MTRIPSQENQHTLHLESKAKKAKDERGDCKAEKVILENGNSI